VYGPDNLEHTHSTGLNTEENGFVTATKLGTRDKFFVDATKHFVVVTKYFCYSYFNK